MGVGAIGVGMRATHYAAWLQEDWEAPACAEMVTENVLGRGGRPLAVAQRVRASSPLFLHGVSMSVGSIEPAPPGYLRELSELVSMLEPDFVSDHLCFGRVSGVSGHDLWPLPHTEEALCVVRDNVLRAQDVLKRPLALENVSSYLRAQGDEMQEVDFLCRLTQVTGCLLLVDVNNIVVSSHNHGFDPASYVRALPAGRVAYLHTAGHSVRGGYRFDDHGGTPDEETCELLRVAFEHFGPVPCVFEWDQNLPSLPSYLDVARSLSA